MTKKAMHLGPAQPKHKRHRRKRAILYIILAVLGLCLLFVGNFNHVQGLLSQHLTALVTGSRGGLSENKPSYKYGKVKPVSPATLAHAYQRRSNYKAVGQIAVPSLDINLNIYKGVGNDVLNLGAGTMKPGQKMGKGNYCLAGHNMDDGKSYFSALYSVAAKHGKLVGRYVYLTDYYRLYTYKIDKAYFIAANRTDLLRSHASKKEVSLFTCDYTGAGRLFVQGRLISRKPLNHASKRILDAFKRK